MRRLLFYLTLPAVIFVISPPSAHAAHHCYLYDNVELNNFHLQEHVRLQDCEDFRVKTGNEYCFKTEMAENDGSIRVSGGCVFTKRCYLYGGLHKCTNRTIPGGGILTQCCCQGFLCNLASSTVISFSLVLFISGHLVNFLDP
uniref:UPAR/Ly6 domain-containing protein n=1 Tax=Plectus sambesii TaxID=2011161 RepID=A0A914XSL0_9BILA